MWNCAWYTMSARWGRSSVSAIPGNSCCSWNILAAIGTPIRFLLLKNDIIFKEWFSWLSISFSISKQPRLYLRKIFQNFENSCVLFHFCLFVNWLKEKCFLSSNTRWTCIFIWMMKSAVRIHWILNYQRLINLHSLVRIEILSARTWTWVHCNRMAFDLIGNGIV